MFEIKKPTVLFDEKNHLYTETKKEEPKSDAPAETKESKPAPDGDVS